MGKFKSGGNVEKGRIDEQYIERVRDFCKLANEEQINLFAPGDVPIVEVHPIAERDLAWAAGFIDGEGCITVTREQSSRNRSVAFRLLLVVANTDKRASEKLRSVFGVGTIQIQNPRNPNWHTRWDWVVQTRQAAYVIRLVEPYLVLKREQAQLALEFAAIPTSYLGRQPTPLPILKRREEIFLKLKAAKLSRCGRPRQKEYVSYTTK